MDEGVKKSLRDMLAEHVTFDQPMGRLTTFRVGGEVEAVCLAEALETLERLLDYTRRTGTPYLVLGGGSNLLVKDGGVKGLAIILGGALAKFERMGETRVAAGAGLRLSDLLNACRREGLSGLEFLAGIPGTVGGAVAMNAGAWGSSTGDLVSEVEMILPSGERVCEPSSALNFSYRRFAMPEGTVVVNAQFQCTPKPPESVAEKVRHYLEKRRRTQPLEHPSGGSVFRNPPGDYAGRLIERAGLKGTRIGGAMISGKHANFIVNTGGATAGDVLALMDLARKRVREESGVDLEPELRVVGT